MSAIVFLPATSTIKSTDEGSSNGRFKIANESSDTLHIFWIDRDGVNKSYYDLSPGSTYNQPATATSDAWFVTNDSGSIAFKFIASTYGTIDVKNSGPAFISFENVITHTALGDWSTWNGYGVINIAKSLGIADDASPLPMNGESNNLELNLVHAPAAWKAGYTGAGVTVAVIDVGIANNAEIAGKIVGGIDLKDGDNDAAPVAGTYHDHSLGVASIIAANHDFKTTGPDTSGVAPDVQLLNVRVGGPSGASYAVIAQGIRWAVDHNAKVLCIPLGARAETLDTGVRDALKYAYDHNVVSIISGGNYSINSGSGLALAAKEGLCMAVGNLDVTSGDPFGSSNMPGVSPYNWVMASSSGYLPNDSGGYSYHTDGGTSYSAPYVAGLAALLVQKYPTATPAEIYKKIVTGAAGTASDAAGDGNATASISPASVHIGTAADTTFTNSNASEVFVGMGKIDTVVYNGARAGFTVAHDGDKFIVTEKSTGIVDSLASIEHVQFSDAAVATDVNGGAGQLFRLYQAAFARTPDQIGLGYWLGNMERGETLEHIAQSFLASAEGTRLYGSGDNAAFLTQLYSNVLHRAPDAAGLQWHLDNMANHGSTRVQELVVFSESAENVANLVGVISPGVAYIPFHA